MKEKMAKVLVSGLVTVSICTPFLSTTTVFAESVADPAPCITPVNANGKRVLFDNTHAQTAGAADWVIDGGFSDYAQGLADEGYFVQELRKETPITYEDLSGYDSFVIPEANIPFKVEEQDAIEQYVNSGGSVFFIADHYNADRNKNRWDASEVFNGYRRGAYEDPTRGMSDDERNSEVMQNVQSSDWLAETFGVRFRYNAIGDINATEIVPSSDCFGITENVESVAMHAGSTIAILDPEVAKGIVYLPEGLDSSDKWGSSVDQGVYEGGGIEEGAYVAIAKKGQGKAAFIGDSSAVEDSTPKYKNEESGKTKKTYDGYAEQDDASLLLQLMEWLTEQENYTSFSETDITLDEATSSLDFELPENSTEPQNEPWATPDMHYKWYDSSTFAVGSYGYVGEETDPPIDNEGYYLCVPDKIVAAQELPLTIRLEGMEPNSKIEHLKVGAYISGGEQVGEFKELSSEWTGNYEYSDEFSVETDNHGNAVKQLTFKLKDGIIGEFNLRIKQGSKNILTQTCKAIEENTDNYPEVGTPVYSIIKPTDMKNDTVMALTIQIHNLNPGETLSNLRIGAYLADGQQIGEFIEPDSEWTGNYGYSDYYSMTADENGKIAKTLLFKIDASISGSANIRLQCGKDNVFTEAITIAE